SIQPLNVTRINIAGEEFAWLPEVQTALKKTTNPDSRIYLTSQNDPTSGIIGLTKCLALEKGGENIRCIFDPDGKLNLDFSNPDEALTQILEKDLLMNVYKDGKFGNYFHLPLEDNVTKNLPYKAVEHAFVNPLTPGDLSSLRWIESSLGIGHEARNNSSLCKVSYAALNFRDVMLATGKLPVDASSGHQDCILGFEFSGLDQAGQRVMGILSSKGLATSVLANPEFLWEIPENWSLEDAATVPIVYATAYYALFNRGRLTPGQSILIHSGTGGVGQAAISIALANNCEVITTVGTEEKRKLIKELFPKLKDEKVGNSRDCSFENQVMELTQGRGVDLVLNSLADDKLQASVRCLGMHGKFLEIGAFDAFANTPLGMSTFLKNTEFHGIFLNQIFTKPKWEKELLKENFKKGIESGVVKPLPRTVFKHDKIEEAFRYMASGKHVGKVLIDVWNQPETRNNVKGCNSVVSAVPRTYFKGDRAYIIVGGLGGLGLEVANWLVERGVKHLILPSRSGFKFGYQKLCFKKWQDQGIKVETPKIDLSGFCTAEIFMKNLLKDVKIGGIFNSSMVLQDGLFQDQTQEKFKSVSEPKINQSSPVCTSVVLLDKSPRNTKGGDLTSTLMNMFGIKDISKLNPDTKLTELGMDSLIGVELKQTLEREYDLPLTVNQMRALTVGDVKRIEAGIMSSKNLKDGTRPEHQGELPFKLHEDALVRLGTGVSDTAPLFIVHGNFGGAETFELLAEKLQCDTYGFQFGPYSRLESIPDIAKGYVEELKQIVPEGPYNIAGYSGGGTIAFEMAQILEKDYSDTVNNLVFLDGSCDWTSSKPSMKTIFTSVLAVAEAFANFTEEEKSDFRNRLGDDFDDNIRLWKEHYQKKIPQVNTDRLVAISSVYIKFVQRVFDHLPTVTYSGKVTLVKTNQTQFFQDELYNIREHAPGEICVHVVRGSHFSFLAEDFVQETADILNDIFGNRNTSVKAKH
ncbi:unnamed protein product, partial [Allacma fusca]